MEKYLRARDRNRELFASAHRNVQGAFQTSVAAFAQLAAQLRDGRDGNGKTRVSLGPFFFILQRQAMAAYETLGANQAFLAWSLVRPGVESALIAGKWVENKANADIWSNRTTDQKAYQRTYEGKALRSESLPRSAEIQGALKALNDRYLHPNPEYYYRHLELTERPTGEYEMKVHFFDDEIDVAVGILGILHLVSVIQDSIAEMFANLFVGAQRIDVGLLSLETGARDWAHDLMARSPYAMSSLKELGLWSESAAGYKCAAAGERRR